MDRFFFSFQGKGKILNFGGHVGTPYIDREYKKIEGTIQFFFLGIYRDYKSKD